jgi:streptogramin lyase
MSGLGTIWVAPNGRVYITGPDDNIILTVDEPGRDLSDDVPEPDDNELAQRDPALPRCA